MTTSSPAEWTGLIGLGAVGSVMALNLAENGFSLLIADSRPRTEFESLLRRGGGRIEWASATDVCRRCTTVLTSLPSVAAIAAVAEQHILPNLRGTWIDLSTTDEAEVKRLGPLAKAQGIDLLEAPLTGGVHLVASGDMTVLVGGNDAVLKRQSALLNTIGGKVIHCGPWGSASVVKVLSNMLAALHLVGVGEAFMLGKKSGIELPALFDALKASAGNSYVLETEGPFIMNGTVGRAGTQIDSPKEHPGHLGVGWASRSIRIRIRTEDSAQPPCDLIMYGVYVRPSHWIRSGRSAQHLASARLSAPSVG